MLRAWFSYAALRKAQTAFAEEQRMWPVLRRGGQGADFR